MEKDVKVYVPNINIQNTYEANTVSNSQTDEVKVYTPQSNFA